MPVEWVEIGPCRLALGDCLEVLPTLSGVDAVVTDPPYGVGLGNRTDQAVANRPYESFDDTPENVRSIVVPAIEQCIGISRAVVVTPGTRCAWFYPVPNEMGAIYFPAGAGFSRWGFTCSQPILYYGKDPYMPLNRKPNSIRCTETSEKNGHPCPKPLGLSEWLVERASLEGDTVLDPFMGSGTTGVACIKTGRKFIGIELEQKYFDIACERIRKAWKLERSKLPLEPHPVMKQRELITA